MKNYKARHGLLIYNRLIYVTVNDLIKKLTCLDLGGIIIGGSTKLCGCWEEGEFPKP